MERKFLDSLFVLLSPSLQEMVSFLDGLYIVFSLIHLLASVLIDGQVFYPPHLVPNALKQVVAGENEERMRPLEKIASFHLISVLSSSVFFVLLKRLSKGLE